jgi:hypothetical protein
VMADGALRKRGELISRRRGVDKLTRTAVHGDGIGVEGHVSARSDSWLPAPIDGSERFVALRRSSVRCQPDRRLAGEVLSV